MTDLEKLKKVFDEIGQGYTIKNETNKETFSGPCEIEFDVILRITSDEDSDGDAIGYEGMFCEFYFLDGKRIATGCWE